MRKIEYLSPSSIDSFYTNLDEFYLNYLCDNKPPRMQQTQPMSVGSAFDAYVKNYFHEKLFGKGHDPRFDLQALFEAQVESQHRDFAWEAGKYILEQYKHLGALFDLLLDLQKSVNTPMFEFEVRGVIEGYREGVTRNISGVTLLGKPDIFYINQFGRPIILDFKVNGYCSNHKTSPMQGYVKLRPGGQYHNDATLFNDGGTIINISCGLDKLNSKWARQLSIYSWLCGVEVGGDYVVAIDQIVGNPLICDLKIAEHRSKIKSEVQYRMFAEAQYAWEVVHSDHIFRDLSLEDSIEKCRTLDRMGAVLKGETGSDNEKWLYETSR